MMLMRLRIFKQSHSAKYETKYKLPLFLIPNLFTLLNAICGFVSIIKVFSNDYSSAAGYIMLGAVMDSLDGRIARAFKCITYFGKELDSLCDAVSFCLAPAVLVYCKYMHTLPTFVKFSLILYLCTGLLRLAKFNLTSEKQQNEFIGLPTPLAALFLSSITLVFPNLNSTLCFIFILSISYLMISNIKFYACKNISFFKLAFLFMIVFSFINFCAIFLLIFSYIFISLLLNLYSGFYWLYHNIINRR